MKLQYVINFPLKNPLGLVGSVLVLGLMISDLSLKAQTGALQRSVLAEQRFSVSSVEMELKDLNSTYDKKSGLLGVSLSIVLPGMGELYAGRFDRGIYPLVTEGVLWGGFFGIRAYGFWLQDDARTFAHAHAGILLEGKDDRYFVDIENYGSIEDYNAQMLIERRLDALYPEDPGAGYSWKWRNDADRQTYKDLRIKSDQMFNGSAFVALGMIANRVWSAIQTAALVKTYNSNSSSQGYQLPDMQSRVLSWNNRPDGFIFQFRQRF